MRMILKQILLGLLLVVPTSAQEGAIERNAKGQTGRDIRLAVFASIKADCTAGQLPTVRLKQAPANGTVTVKQARMRTTNFKQCLAIEAPAFVASYRSAPGFVGQDTILIEVITAGGKVQVQRFTVAVEKPATAVEKPATGQGI